jgi:type IV secretory pathway VirJ component
MADRIITALDVSEALGSTVLQAANNLNDVVSTTSALTNLGAAPAASPTFTGVITRNGVEAIQSHVQVAATAGSTTFPATASTLVITGTGTTAAFTVTLPTTATIVDGQTARVTSSGPTITTLTVTPASGQTAPGAPTTLSPTAPFSLCWIAALSIWVRQ